ncbi:MAG: tetratricopeptide repeat protein [Oleiphilaceae bacterium]|nr:tetratricopeptide repeat protein [Oleiphilaceae bacterium]
MDNGSLWLLLVLALAIGWALGYRYKASRQEAQTQTYTPPNDMKHRLQLLFDTYSDEAIDQFIQGLEVRPDTLPLHISIGKHFRTEGEVDKAILVHQNLMAHPELSDQASEPIIYELAKDYRAAGLYDRAEALLMQLRGSKEFGVRSRKLLLDIYEREQDWEDAVATAQQIDLRKHPDVSLKTAYYWCEIAQRKQQQHNLVEARMALRKALSSDRTCVRAYLMMAEIEIQVGAYQAAIKQLKQVAQFAPEYAVLSLPLLRECSLETDTLDKFHRYLEQLFAETGQMQLQLALIDSLVRNDQREAANTLLSALLERAPDLPVMRLWLKLNAHNSIGQSLPYEAIDKVVEQQYRALPAFQCGHCGFAGEIINWLCPSCRNWQTTKPRLDYLKTSDQRAHAALDNT